MDGEEIRWNNSQQFHANHVFFLRIEFRRHRFRRLTKKTKKKTRKNRIVACLIDDNLGQLLNCFRRKNPRNIKPQNAEEVARQKIVIFHHFEIPRRNELISKSSAHSAEVKPELFPKRQKNDREKILPMKRKFRTSTAFVGTEMKVSESENLSNKNLNTLAVCLLTMTAEMYSRVCRCTYYLVLLYDLNCRIELSLQNRVTRSCKSGEDIYLDGGIKTIS